MKKVLLISPARIITKRDKKRITPPLSFAYIGAVLEENNIEVKILDVALEGYGTEQINNDLITFGLKDEEIKEIIKEIMPDIVGVTMSLSTYAVCSNHICKLVKEVNKNIKVVVGGIHASFFYKKVIKNKNIDFVVVGEGEYAFLDIINNKVKSNIVYGKEIDINKLPLPARHLLNMKKYIELGATHHYLSKNKRVIGILTSRGCSFNCRYCSSTKFFGKWRGLTADNVIKEIKHLIKNYDIEEIHFEDDNMIFDRKRAIKIFKFLKETNLTFCFPNGIIINFVDKELLKLMKEAGCSSVIYGVEVGNKEVLHKIIKKPLVFEKIKEKIDLTKELGIFTNIFLMVGIPGETKENIKETFEFAKYLCPDNVFMSIYTPLPGSELYDECIKNNYLNKGFKFENCLYDKGNITTNEFTSEWLEKYANKEVAKLILYLKFKRFFKGD